MFAVHCEESVGVLSLVCAVAFGVYDIVTVVILSKVSAATEA